MSPCVTVSKQQKNMSFPAIHYWGTKAFFALSLCVKSSWTKWWHYCGRYVKCNLENWNWLISTNFPFRYMPWEWLMRNLLKMVWARDKPLSKPVITQFNNVYMRHWGWGNESIQLNFIGLLSDTLSPNRRHANYPNRCDLRTSQLWSVD